MRVSLLFVSCLVFSASLSVAQHHPNPPGLRQGDKAINEPLEPPSAQPVQQVDLAQLRAEAAELRRLADLLPAQIGQVTKGQLPKDLNDNLKRIEKLAKQLRSELSP
jgi:hypothetical protein